MSERERREKIAALKREIESLSGRLPAHSLKPRMFRELERLEEALARLEGESTDERGAPAD